MRAVRMEAISLDSFPAALVIVHDGRIVQCNALLGMWVGRDVSDLIGHPFDRLVSPPATDPEGEESLPGVMELSCADGSVRPVLVTESLGPEGHRYVTMIDATEQRAFRKRIQARQRLV